MSDTFDITRPRSPRGRAVAFLVKAAVVLAVLFIMSRAANGTDHEVLWVPGTDREKPASAG